MKYLEKRLSVKYVKMFKKRPADFLFSDILGAGFRAGYPISKKSSTEIPAECYSSGSLNQKESFNLLFDSQVAPNLSYFVLLTMHKFVYIWLTDSFQSTEQNKSISTRKTFRTSKNTFHHFSI